MQEQLVVALGDRRYRVDRPFSDLPQGQGIVTDVAVDRRGHVLALLRRDPLLSSVSPAIIELAPDGTRLGAWGTEIADAHMLIAPEDGRVFVADRDAHQILIYNEQGGLQGRLGQRHRPGTPFNHPTDVALMPDGTIVVSDGYGNAQVHVFSPVGEWLRTFGQLGVERGSFLLPHAVWPVGNEHIVVADRENHRLQVFDLYGHLLDVWPGFFRPQAIWGDGQGHLFVTDSIPSLTLLATSGQRLGRCRPVLNGAHGISGDQSTGTLYLAEGSPSRLTRLTPLP